MQYQLLFRERPFLAKLLLVVSLITVNILVLLVLFRAMYPDFPIGWDIPYYISRIRYFEEQNVLSNRVGTISLFASLHTLLGVSLVTLHTYVSVALSSVLAGLTGILSYRLFSRRLIAFLLTFGIVFWSTDTFALTISTLDNSLGLIFAFSAIILFTFAKFSWRFALPFFLLATATAITHFESYLFFLLITAFFFGFRLLHWKSVRKFVSEQRYFLFAVFVSLCIAAIQWQDILATLFSTYMTAGDPSANASIPYVTDGSLVQFFRYAANGIALPIEWLLFFTGVGTIIYFIIKKGKQALSARVVFSYVLTTYVILWVSVWYGSIPINRSVPLVPVSFLISIGLVAIVILALRYSALRWAAISGCVVLAVFLPISALHSYTQRLQPSIQESAYQGFRDVASYVRENEIQHFIVVTNTPQYETAASAFYGLWTNWLTALSPLPDGTISYCVYLGTLDDFVHWKPSLRSENQEYNLTSLESFRCSSELPENTPAFLIPSLYVESGAVRLEDISTTRITGNLFRLNVPVGRNAQ